MNLEQFVVVMEVTFDRKLDLKTVILLQHKPETIDQMFTKLSEAYPMFHLRFDGKTITSNTMKGFVITQESLDKFDEHCTFKFSRII